MFRWLKSSFFPKLKKWIWRICGYKTMVPRLTLHKNQWMTLLRKHFSGYLISLMRDLECSAFPPDLVPCDHFLRRYFKFLVYTNRAKTPGKLKVNILAAIANIDKDKLNKLDQNFRSRISQRIDQSRDRLLDISFKKWLKEDLNVNRCKEFYLKRYLKYLLFYDVLK